MFEIQYHPANIRKGVRFFFLSRRQVRRWLLLAGLFLVTAVSGLVLAPRGLGSVVLWLLSMSAHVRQQHEVVEMERWLAEAEVLRQSLDDSRQVQTRLALIFGAPLGESYAGGAAGEAHGASAGERSRAAVARVGGLLQEMELLFHRTTVLDELVSRRATLLRVVPSICPLPAERFVLSSPFGSRTSPFTGEVGFHTGLDLAAREGTPVMAPGAGTVEFAGWVPALGDVRWWRMGNVVVINHEGLYTTVFAHLSEILVEQGASVQRAQVIGTVGSTGWSTSPHLHYEVRTPAADGSTMVALDPRIFILNHDWNEDDAVLVASRWAPPPPVDPLPNLMEVR